MKPKKINFFEDAIKMVKVYRRAYTFLSVTIVISLTALLVFLLYSDSKIFNEYKDTLKESKYIGRAVLQDTNDLNAIRTQLDYLEDTHYYYYITQQDALRSDVTKELNCYINIVPSYVWGFYFSLDDRMTILDNSHNFNIEKGEAIVCESLYKYVKDNVDNEGNVYIEIPISSKKEGKRYYSFKVIGVCKDSKYDYSFYTEENNIVAQFDLFISLNNFEDVILEDTEKYITVYSEHPQKVNNIFSNLGVVYGSVYEDKINMYERMSSETVVKTSIAISLLFLLGINLYSSFNNALNERKFEIGVRRAIGASKKSIIIQFFTEGMIVMLMDVVISTVLAFIIMAVYKIYMFYFASTKWIININKCSITIYLCCCLFLTLVFSIIFAIKSTSVQVTKYLKSE